MEKFISVIILIISFLTPLSFAYELEKGSELFNQREYEQARAIFESLSNGGDIEATYWLCASQYRTGEKFEAGHTYLKGTLGQWINLCLEMEVRVSI